MSSEKNRIKIAAIIGSVRPNNLTARALFIVIDEIKKYPQVDLEIIDPSRLNLDLPGKESDNSSAPWLQKIVSQATGVILSTPEYHGSYSSVIKLVIDNLGYPSVLSGKPVALLGVAAGQIGAVTALEHLRSVCSHVGAIVLPWSISVARAHTLFDEKGRCLDKKIEKEIRSVAVELISYIKTHIYPIKGLEEVVREN